MNADNVLKKNYVYGQKHAFFLSRAPVNLLIPSDTFLNMIILYLCAIMHCQSLSSLRRNIAI